MDLIDEAEAVEVLVEEDHLGLHALGDPRCVPSHVAGTEHDDPTGLDAGRPTQQDAAAAPVTLEVMGADLGGHAAGDLAHRRQQRQGAVVQLHCLVTDGGRLGVQQVAGDLGIGSQVQVGEQHEIRAQASVLRGLRLLDLDNQLGSPRVLDRHRLGAGGLELGVGDRRALTGAALDEHLMAGDNELTHTVGREGDPVLSLLDLGGNADLQGFSASNAKHRPMIDLASTRRPVAMSIGTSSRATRTISMAASSGLWADTALSSRSNARNTHDRSSEKPGEF